MNRAIWYNTINDISYECERDHYTFIKMFPEKLNLNKEKVKSIKDDQLMLLAYNAGNIRIGLNIWLFNKKCCFLSCNKAYEKKLYDYIFLHKNDFDGEIIFNGCTFSNIDEVLNLIEETY